MNFSPPSYIGEISSKSSDLTEKQSSNYKKTVGKKRGLEKYGENFKIN